MVGSTLARALGLWYVVVGVLTIAVALVQESISSWGGFGYVAGAAIVIITVLGAYMAATGKGGPRPMGMTNRTRILFYAVMAVIALSAILNIASSIDNWTVTKTLNLGISLEILGVLTGILLAPQQEQGPDASQGDTQ